MENIYQKLLGIPFENPNYYQLFGFSMQKFQFSELENNYKKQLQKLQKLGNNPKYKAAILYLKSELRKARSCLENKEQKEKYDRFLLLRKREKLDEMVKLFAIKGYIEITELRYLEKKAKENQINLLDLKAVVGKLPLSQSNFKKDFFYLALLAITWSFYPLLNNTPPQKKEIPKKVEFIKEKTTSPQSKNIEQDIPSNMVYIPEGDFHMGDLKGDRDETPIRKIYISEFYISKYEVTNEEYAVFVKEAKYPPPYTSDPNYKQFNWNPLEKKMPFGKGKHPVVLVTWKNAIDYCKWLSNKLELKVTLPTEAQWEKAARGRAGLSQYPWLFPQANRSYANSNSKNDGFIQTAPVHSFSEGCSPFGCYNMSGNVSEWCLDNYHPRAYDFLSLQNPVYLDKKKDKVIRGGSWGSELRALRVSNRNYRKNDSRSVYIGFRYVISVDK